MNEKTIYTHDIAAGIVERFEDVLVEKNICVPSPDDDERSEEDKVGLFCNILKYAEKLKEAYDTNTTP